MCCHVNKKTDVSAKQRYAVKFCVTLKKSKVGLITLFKEAFQNETLHDSTTRRWHRAFMDDREAAEIEHAGRRPRTVVTDVDINTVSVVIKEDCYLFIRKLADDLHIL